ncbi:hypothetical protein GGP41_003124 [Bipolaris sorokiniana]|uniref:Uncharacterized protein n=1 Tax=Cochliobolus sativus TaxID=45130 RepID=A0A8H5ZCE7_COCSA|nr:hypothetical protein GGP41_003124 [Bipolaris sorokiniana]
MMRLPHNERLYLTRLVSDIMPNIKGVKNWKTKKAFEIIDEVDCPSPSAPGTLGLPRGCCM